MSHQFGMIDSGYPVGTIVQLNMTGTPYMGFDGMKGVVIRPAFVPPTIGPVDIYGPMQSVVVCGMGGAEIEIWLKPHQMIEVGKV